MTTTTFPPIAPSKHPTITAGRFPHVRKRSTGGRQSLIRLGNAQLDGTISLVYSNIDTSDLLQLLSHWRNVRGTARDFALPADLFPSMDSNTRERLMATAWRFKDAPKVVDICGGVPGFLLHSVDITLLAQPRRVASPTVNGLPELPVVAPGARWGVVMAWKPGLAGVNTIRPRGAEWIVQVGWQKGAAQIVGERAAPGAAWSVTTSWASGGRTTSAAAWAVGVAFAGGGASIQGLAPGAALQVPVEWTAGRASVPPQPAGGAAWSIGVAWVSGASNITGGTAPGAALNVTSSWAGGTAQSIGPGAALAVTVIWLSGGSGSDPYFSNVSLLLPLSGANNSTTFIDQSSNNFSITRNGNAIITTANPRFGTGSLLINQQSTYLITPANSAFSLGTQDFTVEFDLLRSSTNNDQGIFTFGGTNSGLHAVMDGSVLLVGVFGGDPPQISGGNIPLNTWVRVTITRSNQTLRALIDGIQAGNTISNNTNLTDNQLKIGYSYLPNNNMTGQLANFRVTKGIARNFTPPSGPHPTS